ncbi:MAG: thioredoxin, partial [Vulcanococcus sp.]
MFRPLARLLKPLAALALSLVLALGVLPAAAQAARDTNSYDGNIYALYAGNGSLVPPRSTL